MSKLMELYDKRNVLVASTRAFLDGKQAVSDTLTAEDETAYNKMEADISTLSKAIERESRLSSIENEMRQPTSQPILGQPTSATLQQKSGRASDDYKAAFMSNVRDPKRVSDVLSVGVDSEGGYLVPEEFERTIVRGLEENNIIRGLANVISTGGERKIPLSTSDPSAVWTDENETITESSATFGQTSLSAYKLALAIRVSNELLADNVFNLDSYITAAFARAEGIAEEQAFLTGNGTNKPTGIFNTTNGGTLGVTTASATQISFDELISLVYSLKSPYRRNAAFILNDTTVALLRKVKDGNGQFVWQPSVQAGQPDRLLGFPLYTSPYVPAVAAGNISVAFGDFKNYTIADRGGRVFKRLNELFAMNDQTGFIGTARLDGKVILREGIKLLQQHA